ncbi:MAG TPA: 4Fe-4S binding protein [Fibrobacteraceae bacterium]|nr:4Fe-4S binding protein [Fibrobacteraceae bacterium]
MLLVWGLWTGLVQAKVSLETVETPLVASGLEDEFQAMSEESEESVPSIKNWKDKIKDSNVYEPLGLFLLIAIIGFFIKFPPFQKIRGLFLVASIVYFGFYRGACPCMISSFQNLFLYLMGAEVASVSLLWFLILIPATYLFGKIWCGWLCHLGALQEVLHHSTKFQFLESEHAQKVLRILQNTSLVVLVAQLLITRTNIFYHYDPFKIAYNLHSTTVLGYVLLVLLLVSSVFLYRPFCRGFCPVGLILGWVGRLPGARRLIKGDECVNCLNCSKECQSHALEHHGKTTTFSQERCILCGECLDCCRKNALHLERKR